MTERYFPEYGYGVPPRRQGGTVGVGGISNWLGTPSPKDGVTKPFIRIGTSTDVLSSSGEEIKYPFLRFQSVAIENHSVGIACHGIHDATDGWVSSLRIYGGSQQQTDDYRMITYMTEYDDHPTRPGLAYQSTGIWDLTDAAGTMAEAVTYWSKQDGTLGYISNYGSNHHWYDNPQHGVAHEQMMSMYGPPTRSLQIGSATQSYNLNVIGNLSKSSGTFDIEHPTVEGKRLRHSFIEGPQADLIYRGTAELGAAPMVIDMDTEFDMTAGTWEALNCTPWSMVSASGKVVEWEFEGSTLTITGDEGTTCMWMVIGERHDPHMKGSDCDVADTHGRLIVEYDAPDPLPGVDHVVSDPN